MKSVEWYDLGPFHLSLGVALGKKAYLKEYKRLTSEDKDEGATFDAYAFVTDLVDPDGNHSSLVYFNEKLLGELPENLAGVCAHEAMHVAQNKWRRWGEREPGREAEAYLLQFITTKFYSFLKKRKKSPVDGYANAS